MIRRPRVPHITLPTRLRSRWARLLLAMAVVAALAVTAVSVTAGKDSGRHDADRAGQDRDKDAQDSDQGKESEEGEEGEDDGGPVAPAEYLTQKFTSGQNVSQAQIEHANCISA